MKIKKIMVMSFTALTAILLAACGTIENRNVENSVESTTETTIQADVEAVEELTSESSVQASSAEQNEKTSTEAEEKMSASQEEKAEPSQESGQASTQEASTAEQNEKPSAEAEEKTTASQEVKEKPSQESGQASTQEATKEKDNDPAEVAHQSGEESKPTEAVADTGAISDYTQCTYYKTKQGKDSIEYTLKNSFAALDGIPSDYIKKPMDTAAAQQQYKELLAKNDCKNEEEAASYRDQVLNTYYDLEGVNSYYAKQQSEQQSQSTQQQQQDPQEDIDFDLPPQTDEGDNAGSAGGDASSLDDLGEWD